MTVLAESLDSAASPVHSAEFAIVSTVLRIASAARARLAEALKAQGLSWARYEVLELVCRTGPLPYSTLSQELVRHRTSITATAASLVDAGLLARSINPCNRQQYLLDATDSGLRAVRRAERALERARSRMTVDADSEQVLEILRGIERQWNAGSHRQHRKVGLSKGLSRDQ